MRLLRARRSARLSGAVSQASLGGRALLAAPFAGRLYQNQQSAKKAVNRDSESPKSDHGHELCGSRGQVFTQQGNRRGGEDDSRHDREYEGGAEGPSARATRPSRRLTSFIARISHSRKHNRAKSSCVRVIRPPPSGKVPCRQLSSPMQNFRRIDSCRVRRNTNLVPLLNLSEQSLAGAFPRERNTGTPS